MAEQMDWSKMLGAGYFRDRTVLITGASNGIGCDIAMSLSRMGAQVAKQVRKPRATTRNEPTRAARCTISGCRVIQI
jgi:NADP-dependent 3-hydroxy acid dehydrogenase YdfG